MSLLVIGTFPERAGEIVAGRVSPAQDGCVEVGDLRLPCGQGTSAMLAAAATVTRHLGSESVFALLGGDTGHGDGTRAVAAVLARAVEAVRPSVVAFHYVQPLMELMAEAEPLFCHSSAHCHARLVADAGGMYAANAAGLAPSFELMTPDVGEIAFLADPETTHPAHLADVDTDAERFDPVALAQRAAESGGCARILLIKGRVDHIVVEGRLEATVEEPSVPALEAIGGTGDTITGIAAALMSFGFTTVDAALCAARANREAGVLLGARPDHQARDLVAHIPAALSAYCPGAASCHSPTERSLS